MKQRITPDNPYSVINAEAPTPAPVLLLCDHASNRIPTEYAQLGLPDSALQQHIAFDIGTAALARLLTQRFNCAAVLSGYSRLLIDCNRQPGDPTSIIEVSDGITVPGNQTVSDEEAAFRLETFFWPYHHAVTQTLAQLWRHGPAPAVISLHSFSRYFSGLSRPWHIGVLWNHDPRIAQPLLRWLHERHPDLVIGDNEPYSGREVGFTVDHHAGAAGLPHIALEIRQDLIADPAGQAHWADIIGDALEAVLSNASLHQVEHY